MKLRPFIEAPPLLNRGAAEDVAVDGVGLARCLEHAPTPFYLTSLGAVEDRARAYVDALARHAPGGIVHYALKANFAPEVVDSVRRAGAGVDIVSVGEWRAALRAGAKPGEICFAGVGKRPGEWREAIEGGLGHLNAEHADEALAVLDLLASLPAARTRVSLRLNPCVELDTHPHLRTGALDSKFGMLEGQVVDFLASARARAPSAAAFAAWLAPLRGVHVHVGSQLQDASVFGHVAARAARLARILVEAGAAVDHFDLGGGLGVGPGGVPEGNADVSAHVGFLCRSLREALAREVAGHPSLARAWGADLGSVTIALEPGRSVVASSTLLVTRVLYEKSNAPGLNFAYVDAGMNDFPRPSIYGAKHHVEFLAREGGCAAIDAWTPSEAEGAPGSGHASHAGGLWQRPYQVVGPVCESGDVLARRAVLPRLVPGDLLGFLEAGAYCRSMASHYNLRPLPAEVFVRGGEIVAARAPREP